MKNKIILLTMILLISTKSFSQTQVSGGIYSNTTWSLTNSPYIVTDDVVIFGGVSLTIEPGVNIKFYDGKKLEVRGALSAIGNINDTINFTSNSSTPTQSIWIGLCPQVNSSLALIYCKISYATSAIDWANGHYSTHTIKHSNFSNNYYGFHSNPASTIILDSCLFEGNYEGILSSFYKTFSNCTFKNNNYGVYDADGCNIQNCVFIGNTEIGLKGWRGTIENCSMTNNNIGISYSMQDHPIISNNNITNNTIGFRVTGNVPTAEITNNYICNNIQYNVKNTISDNINFANNCWCLSDSSSIRATIYDGYNDVSVGLINFMPFKTNCDNTGINFEFSNLNCIKIFPNPASNIINFELCKMTKVEIIDFTGKFICQFETNKDIEQLNVSSYPKGIYLIKLLSEKYFTSEKIIIN